MNSTSEYIKHLKKAKAEVEAEIRDIELKKARLEAHKEQISDLLNKIAQDETPLRFEETKNEYSTDQQKAEKLKPLEAIKKILSYEPNRTWTPPDLRDKLTDMLEAGELDSKAKDLLWIVHSSMKSLKKTGWVEVIPDKDQPAYKKRNVDNQSSLLEEQKNDD